MSWLRSPSLAAAALVLAAACTVPTNDEPIELSGSIVPETTTTTSTTQPEVDARTVAVYFLSSQAGSTELVPVTRAVDLGSGVQGVLANLFRQRPSNEQSEEVSLATAIPESATLVSASPSAEDPSLLVVEVAGLFGNTGVQGATLRDALAQIVWTATQPGTEVDAVVFRQDGERREALVDDLVATANPVRRRDYALVS
jgi:hypothetical protein